MHIEYRNPIFQQLRDHFCSGMSREALLSRMEAAEQLISRVKPNDRLQVGYVIAQLIGRAPADACTAASDVHADAVHQKSGPVAADIGGIGLQEGPDCRLDDRRTEWELPVFWQNTRSRISARDLLHDLWLLVEELSDQANLQADAMGEPVFTVTDLARRFDVSTKTISRWRAIGLVSRRLVFDGRKRVGFLRSSVDRFVKENADRVKRGTSFSQITETQRQDIVGHAKKMACDGDGQAEIARNLAIRTQRSVETIRSVLRQHDQTHPNSAIFPTGVGPLTEEQKHNIYQSYGRGAVVERLCQDYNRTKTTIYRVINEVRAQRIMAHPLEYIDNERFSRKGADYVCLGPMPENTGPVRKSRRPAGLPPYLASLYEMPLLTREQERHIFRMYNYLKYKATKLRSQLNLECPKAALMDQIELLFERIVETKNEISRANLRLVVSIAKRHVTPDQNFFELVSDGNISLLRAAEKFDYSRGNKFSTYASWAIMKNFARTIPTEYRRKDRFRTSHEDLFAVTQEDRPNPIVQESIQRDRISTISRILKRLDDREQKIIIGRFGLDHSHEPLTLKEVGEQLGVTKERIRQIEARALNKLRLVAQEEKITLDL
jgi:RNA polymerase primary sigma factor